MEALVSKIKRDMDPYARTTTELSLEETNRLVRHTVPDQEKDTSPEIPVRQLLLHHERMLAQKKARNNADSANAAAKPTGPGVYIKVGQGKVVWVEGESPEEKPINLTTRIYG
jgi:hypothetical protein